MPKKNTVEIEPNKVRFSLSIPRSRVRIADKYGNHIAKPTEAQLKTDYYIEWMITNEQVKALSEKYLDSSDKAEIKRKITSINKFLKESEYAKRIARADEKPKPEEYLGFKIYEYTDTFYSFLKKLPSGISIRHTFKQGDYTLADNMYVLLPFNNSGITIFDKEDNAIAVGSKLNGGAYAIWKPTKTDVKNIIEALSYASKNHKEDLLELI